MTARVRALDIEDDTLPRVCVVTGDVGEGHWRVRYLNPAGALWLLLLLGVLPFVLARFLTRHEVEGRLPISDEGIAVVRAARRRWRIGACAAFVLAAGGIVLGVATGSLVVALVGLGAALVLGLVTAIVYDDPVSGAVEQNGRWVRLRGTHPAFDAAVTRQPTPGTSS